VFCLWLQRLKQRLLFLGRDGGDRYAARHPEARRTHQTRTRHAPTPLNPGRGATVAGVDEYTTRGTPHASGGLRSCALTFGLQPCTRFGGTTPDRTGCWIFSGAPRGCLVCWAPGSVIIMTCVLVRSECPSAHGGTLSSSPKLGFSFGFRLPASFGRADLKPRQLTRDLPRTASYGSHASVGRSG
jgi:hypothetical protein